MATHDGVTFLPGHHIDCKTHGMHIFFSDSHSANKSFCKSVKSTLTSQRNVERFLGHQLQIIKYMGHCETITVQIILSQFKYRWTQLINSFLPNSHLFVSGEVAWCNCLRNRLPLEISLVQSQLSSNRRSKWWLSRSSLPWWIEWLSQPTLPFLGEGSLSFRSWTAWWLRAYKTPDLNAIFLFLEWNSYSLSLFQRPKRN